MVLFLGGIMGEQYTIAERMKQLRNITGFNRAEFARQQGIPLRTIEEWEAGRRKMPEYVLRLLAYKIQLESSKKDQRIHLENRYQYRFFRMFPESHMCFQYTPLNIPQFHSSQCFALM